MTSAVTGRIGRDEAQPWTLSTTAPSGARFGRARSSATVAAVPSPGSSAEPAPAPSTSTTSSRARPPRRAPSTSITSGRSARPITRAGRPSPGSSASTGAPSSRPAVIVTPTGSAGRLATGSADATSSPAVPAASPHRHDFENPLYTCGCGRTAEEERRGYATHPGRPTSERIWELVLRLARSR